MTRTTYRNERQDIAHDGIPRDHQHRPERVRGLEERTLRETLS